MLKDKRAYFLLSECSMSCEKASATVLRSKKNRSPRPFVRNADMMMMCIGKIRTYGKKIIVPKF